MKRSIKAFGELKGCQSGAAAIEFAIIALVLILVCLGVIEFGRSLQVRNELSFAADFGARKILTDSTISDSDLENVVRSALIVADPDLMQVTIGTETVDGVQFRTIALAYPFTLLIPGLSSDSVTLALARRTPIS
jgi:Flp pilus assembly protein TadG